MGDLKELKTEIEAQKKKLDVYKNTAIDVSTEMAYITPDERFIFVDRRR